MIELFFNTREAALRVIRSVRVLRPLKSINAISGNKYYYDDVNDSIEEACEGFAYLDPKFHQNFHLCHISLSYVRDFRLALLWICFLQSMPI